MSKRKCVFIVFLFIFLMATTSMALMGDRNNISKKLATSQDNILLEKATKATYHEVAVISSTYLFNNDKHEVVFSAKNHCRSSWFTTESKERLSMGHAVELKGKLQAIEEHYLGQEKIKEQIRVLQEADLLSSNFTYDRLAVYMEKKPPSFFVRTRNAIFGGPMLISHFTPFSRIYGTGFNNVWFYNHTSDEIDGFFNSMLVDSVIAGMPTFLGVGFTPVFVTAVDYRCSKVITDGMYFPFVEFLTPCMGTSIRVIIETDYCFDILLFEINLDVCLFGFLGGSFVNA